MLRVAARAALVGALVVLVGLGPQRASAQQGGGEERPEQQRVTALYAGNAAPYSGILVPHKTFARCVYKDNELILEREKVKTRDDLLLSCAKERDACVASYNVASDALKPRHFLDRWWVGAISAVLVIAGGAVAWHYAKGGSSSTTATPEPTTPTTP